MDKPNAFADFYASPPPPTNPINPEWRYFLLWESLQMKYKVNNKKKLN